MFGIAWETLLTMGWLSGLAFIWWQHIGRHLRRDDRGL